jgi:hypothetical protein
LAQEGRQAVGEGQLHFHNLLEESEELRAIDVIDESFAL